MAYRRRYLAAWYTLGPKWSRSKPGIGLGRIPQRTHRDASVCAPAPGIRHWLGATREIPSVPQEICPEISRTMWLTADNGNSRVVRTWTN